MLLVLLDNDSLFLEMVASYIRGTEHAERFAVKAFSRREQGFDFLERVQEPFILLVHQSFFPLPEQTFRHPFGRTLILSGSPSVSDVLEYPLLFKYQPLDRLMDQVVAHYNEYATACPLRGKRASQVIAVYSATGGTGKTTLSLHLAKQSALLEKSAFYLNLELFNVLSGTLAPTGKDPFAQALYYAKTNPKQLAAKLGTFTAVHPQHKFSYFEPVTHVEELEEMGEAEAAALIDALAESGDFHTIVIDLESSLHPRVTAALARCDRLLWLVLDEAQQLQKTRLLLKRLREGAVPDGPAIARKAELVVNKHTGRLANRLEPLGQRIAGDLPYVPQWKSYSDMEQLLHGPAFQERALRLLQDENELPEVKRIAGA